MFTRARTLVRATATLLIIVAAALAAQAGYRWN